MINILLTLLCFFSPYQKDSYQLDISKIDNRIDVFVQDSLVYSSGTIHLNPEVNFIVDLSSYIKKGNEILRIEIYNGSEPYKEQLDPHWEVMFDLIKNDEIIDYIYEFSDNNEVGKVFEISYNLKEW